MSYNPINTHIPQGFFLSDIVVKELVPDTYPVVEKYANTKLAFILSQHAKAYEGDSPRHLADFGTAERFHRDVTKGVTDMHDRAMSFLMYQQLLDGNNNGSNLPPISYSNEPESMAREYLKILNILKGLKPDKLTQIAKKVGNKVKESDFSTKGLDGELAKEFDKSIGWYVWSNYQSLARNTEFVSSTGLREFQLTR